MKDNAVLDMEYDRTVYIYGMLQVTALPESNATFTCHKSGGDVEYHEGLKIRFFNDADDYDPVTGHGCLLQNTLIENLDFQSDVIGITDCSPKFYNCKIIAIDSLGRSYFGIWGNSAPVIENCSIDNMVITINTDLRGTDASIKYNTCRDGYYTIYFSDQANPAVDSGMISNNDFDWSVHGLYLFNMTGVTDIPLGSNYWNGGQPSVN